MLKNLVGHYFTFVFIFFKMVTISYATVQDVQPANEEAVLFLKIENILNNCGSIKVIVWDNPNDYLKEENKPYLFLNAEAPYTSKQLTLPIKGLIVGQSYALFIYHDLTNRGFLKKNFFGKPIDPYAFSGGNAHLLKPPKYKDALVPMKYKSNHYTIKLK